MKGSRHNVLVATNMEKDPNGWSPTLRRGVFQRTATSFVQGEALSKDTYTIKPFTIMLHVKRRLSRALG